MRLVTLAAAALLLVGLLVQAQGLSPAQALSAGTSGWSRACKNCMDKCDTDYPKGGGPLITCRKLCRSGSSPACKSKLLVQPN